MGLVDFLKSLPMKKQSDAKEKIKEPEDKLSTYLSEMPMKKTYAASEVEVRPYKTTPKLCIYVKEMIEKDYNGITNKATNIEDKNDIIKYKVNYLPAGRVIFGGYLDDCKPRNKEFYSLADVWYKTFGKILSCDSRFTEEELQTMANSIKKHQLEAKFDYLYEVKYKDSFKGKRAFEDSKYIGQYSQYLSEKRKNFFEEIYTGDVSVKQQSSDEHQDDIVIKVGDKDINTGYFSTLADQINGSISHSSETAFEINILANPGKSRVFNKYKFTPTALKQIVKEYEQEKERGEK